MVRLALIGCLLALGLASQAADPVKLPKELTYVPNDVLAFGSLNASEVGGHPAFKGFLDSLSKSAAQDEVQGALGLKLDEFERVTIVVPMPPAPMPGERHLPPPQPILLLTTKKPFEPAAVLKAGAFYTMEEVKEIKAKRRDPDRKLPPPAAKPGASHYANTREMVLAFLDDRTMALVFTANRRAKDQLPGDPRDLLKSMEPTGPLTEGIALAASKPVAFAVNMSSLRQISELEAPPNEVLPLLKADKALGFISLGKDAAELTVTASYAGMQWSADAEETARALKTLAGIALGEEVKRMKKREGDDSPMAKIQELFVKSINAATVKRTGNDVAIQAKFDLGEDARKLLATLPETASETAARARSANNLKQIGLSFHAHADTTNTLAANTYDKDGKPLLSWRVQLLPYLEQGPLYNEFKLDEPWDSEHNKKLIAKIPPPYLMPGIKTKEPGQTYYRSFTSAKDASTYAVMADGNHRRMQFGHVTDGLSNTIFCIEADEPCIWTKPDDIPFDPKGKIAIRGGLLVKDRFQALFGDGSVRSLNAKMPEATLKAYITVNGGEVINDD